ncbi:MAG TPA: metallophosphoesterase [Polyangiales bacterium]|nr:metallophosphoesterase [Polyangiales bacterium]
MGAVSALWRIVPFLLALFAVLGGYVWWRASSSFQLTRPARWLLAITLVVGMASSLAARELGIEDQALAQWLGAFGGAVIIGVLLSAALSLPAELVRGLVRVATPNVERRAFLQRVASGSAIAIGGGAAVYGTLFGRHDYTIETVPVPLAKLPRALDGFTIVQLSDLHVGTFIGERELAAALALVREAKPDLIVLTGDLLDHDPAYAPMLGRFARSLAPIARHGTFAVPGNHDYYGGIDEVLAALARGGAQVLRDRHTVIGDAGGRFVLGGVDDAASIHYGRQGPRPEQAFAGADPELARVLLSHNPITFPKVRPFADLTLSGHTHGGQISLFVNPASLVLEHGRIRGLYRADDAQLYVNRGFGTAGPPTRVGSPPEVTRLVLTSA